MHLKARGTFRIHMDGRSLCALCLDRVYKAEVGQRRFCEIQMVDRHFPSLRTPGEGREILSSNYLLSEPRLGKSH